MSPRDRKPEEVAADQAALDARIAARGGIPAAYIDASGHVRVGTKREAEDAEVAHMAREVEHARARGDARATKEAERKQQRIEERIAARRERDREPRDAGGGRKP